MASLNTSLNGPSITKSYQTVVNAPPPSGAAAASPTYGQWAVFSVTAPLASAFADAGSKESVLKVQSSGEGELLDLVEEFSDGRIQFAYVKVKDSNSGLPKNALIAWCGEGVPERTKGYFGSHLAAVSKLLHGYHVQITARSDRDLTPDSIITKVAEASGSKYSTSSGPPPISATKPAIAPKPAFNPTLSSGVALPTRTARRADPNVDADGWGADAPPVVRTQLEKVQPAYQPTKVDMRSLSQQQPAAAAFNAPPQDDRPGVVRGAYQPVGKVDIAEIRRQAKESGQLKDDRPETVKGSYEPVGKVDIAAIRARAQPGPAAAASIPDPTPTSPETSDAPTMSMAQRSAAFSQQPERLTSMPKPKVANKFGGGSTFTGTKAPVPGGFDTAPAAAAAGPGGSTSRTFADQGGKTPAQIWAEKKARERGTSGSGGALPPSGYTGASPVVAQTSGGGGWESGYTGKKWGAVNTTHTGRGSIPEQTTGDAPASAAPASAQEADEDAPSGGFGSIRDRFAGAAPMGAPASYDRAPPSAPEPETSTKPNRGIPIPGLGGDAGIPPPPAVPRTPEPEPEEEPEREASPIRVAVPVARNVPAPIQSAHEEVASPPEPIPAASIARAVPPPQPEEDEPETSPDPARHAAQATAAANLGKQAVDQGPSPTEAAGGERARAEYDYEKAEDNEVSLTEGEIVTDIQKLDPDWWLVTNSKGEQGLVPSNYLAMIEDDEGNVPHASTANVIQQAAPAAPAAPEPETPAAGGGKTAVALYDYEAGEDNEISFPEDALITNVSFPDEDWWHGEYQGHEGLFPAAYVELKG